MSPQSGLTPDLYLGGFPHTCSEEISASKTSGTGALNLPSDILFKDNSAIIPRCCRGMYVSRPLSRARLVLCSELSLSLCPFRAPADIDHIKLVILDVLRF